MSLSHHFLRAFVKKLFPIALSILSLNLLAKPPALSEKDLSSPPPKIIRTCCSFGYDLGVVGIPGKKITKITSLDRIGTHKYLGSKEEGNGIIYTKRGGFIDLGHLRDLADWTAYLYSLISNFEPEESLDIMLGHEGGEKVLQIQLHEFLSDRDKKQLAGRIAYDLSLWHEIATWFGASYIPFLPEKYSSFSVEDMYSNILGIELGIKALESDLPYEEAMTELIALTMRELEAVESYSETYEIMKNVENIWWTKEKKLPSEKVLIQRNLEVYSFVRPWLVAGWASDRPEVLVIPDQTEANCPLTDYYRLSIDLNYRFPMRKMFPYKTDRVITQEDFDVLIFQVAEELLNDELKKDIDAKINPREWRKHRIDPSLIIKDDMI